jgi:hypothetical protein
MNVVSTWTLLDGTPVAEIQAGNVYFEPHAPEHRCAWDNCDGQHLVCMVPGKLAHGQAYLHRWNVDGRASNCDMPNDRLHRCWVRHGDPRVPGQLHVDKVGKTCRAGAGSIAIQGFHGFLHAGELA